MTTPYITPTMLTNLAPFGIDWQSIPTAAATSQANLAALYDICLAATGAIDLYCNMPLRAVAELETLDGPDQRLAVRQSTGVGVALMQHWPIVSVLGAQVTNSGSFPRAWSPVPATMLDVLEPSSKLVGGGGGLSGVVIAPGYIDWVNGRHGYTIQIAYVNGFPIAGLMASATPTGTLASGNLTITAVSSTVGVAVGAPIADFNSLIPAGATVAAVTANSITLAAGFAPTGNATAAKLQVGYAAGVTTLNVDDVTGLAGQSPQLWDGAFTEVLSVSTAVANNPVTLIPGVIAQSGPGVVTLSTATSFAHAGTQPAQVVLSVLPDVVREAGYYYAAAEAMQRGSTAFTVPAVPGSVLTGGQPSSASFIKAAQQLIAPLRRVF